MATEGMDTNEVDELSGWAEALEEQKNQTRNQPEMFKGDLCLATEPGFLMVRERQRR